MADDVRADLTDLLTDELGPVVDTEDFDNGWLTAHVALRAVEWTLESAGYPDSVAPGLWRRLASNDAVDAVSTAHRAEEYAWIADDAHEWPTPVDAYVGLIERTLGVDLAALNAAPHTAPHLRPPLRFAAPNEPAMVAAITARDDFFGRVDPLSWLIQRRVGRPSLEPPDVPTEINRFVAHWPVVADTVGSWTEISRADAVTGMAAEATWLRDRDLARAGATRFLACFTPETRHFVSDCSRPSYVALGRRLAGLW